MAKSTQWLKKVDSYLNTLANEKDIVRASEMFLKHLNTMSKFWSYSRHNQILLMLQMPEASIVAGFRKWKTMGRWVRKGERSLKILAPGLAKDEDADDPDVRRIRYFFPVSVFDITQTDGDELEVITMGIDGDGAKDYFDALASHCEENGTAIKYEAMGFNRYGASRNGEISIAEGGSWNTKFATFIHEMAHELLHWDGDKATKLKEEVEAEAISYVVLTHYGLETKAPEYLALYNPDRKLLEASLGHISDVAKQIITSIESKLEREAVA